MTEDEIKKDLKGISDITSPGIDGYNAKLFKATWDVTKENVIEVFQEFVTKKKIYKAINNTIVALIPKMGNAKMVKDYRPISFIPLYTKSSPRS